MRNLAKLRKEIKNLADPQRAQAYQRFFKTGKGEYGQGDVFWGLTMPQVRVLARRYAELSGAETMQLLHSKYHEERMLALVVMVGQFERLDLAGQARIFRTYLANSKHINNWDLVDVTAPHIVGKHLLDKPRTALYRLARSKLLWDRRIAVLSTLPFIRAGQFGDTLALAELLLADRHDLMHKAVGWMLREVGNRSPATLKKFLDKRAAVMPRTMLRYAIEKFPQQLRKKYLSK